MKKEKKIILIILSILLVIIIIIFIICYTLSYQKKILIPQHESWFETDISKQKLKEIDIVYIWEPNRDIERIKARKKFLYGGKIYIEKSKDPDNIRFECCDEIKYSIRSIERFFPIYRKIFIVISGDVIPNWINTTNSKLVIIKHQDIFTEKSSLPNFNSNAIELNIYKIPNLSNNFVYFNDDFFLGDNLYYNDIFTKDNKIKLYHDSKNKLKLRNCDPKKQQSGYDACLCNSNILLNKYFTYKETRKIVHHQARMMNKQVLEFLNKKFPYESSLTSSSRFRSYTDISTVFLQNELASILGVGKLTVTKNQKLVNLDSPFSHQIIAKMKKYKFFCLNNGRNKDYDFLIRFFNKKFPKPSSFEKIPDVIISLTTSSLKIKDLEPLIQNLYKQDYLPTKIIINIFENYKIPKFFKKYKLISINHCNKNWGPALKFIPTLLKYKNLPDHIIIVIKDNVIYDNNLISNYLKYENKYPNTALCLKGLNLPNEDVHSNNIKTITNVDVMESYGSYLIKSKFVDFNKLTNYNKNKKGEFPTDDLWISNNLENNKIKKVIIPFN